MARKNKIGLQIEGFDDLIQQFKELEKDIKPIAEEALRESQKIIAAKSHEAMSKHHKTGDTEKTIIEDGKVEWEGSEVGIGVGFDIKVGGLPSIFLMYGTPRMKKDSKVYNAVYGKKTMDEVSMIQALIFADAINNHFGG